MDIIDYADRVKASIVEEMLGRFLETGSTIKSAFLAEGKTEKDYQGFLKKVKRITRKSIRDFNKK